MYRQKLKYPRGVFPYMIKHLKRIIDISFESCKEVRYSLFLRMLLTSEIVYGFALGLISESVLKCRQGFLFLFLMIDRGSDEALSN